MPWNPFGTDLLGGSKSNEIQFFVEPLRRKPEETYGSLNGVSTDLEFS